MQQRKKRARQRCSGHLVRQRCNAEKQQWGNDAFEAGWGHRCNTAKNERGSDVLKNGWGQRCNTAKKQGGNDVSENGWGHRCNTAKNEPGNDATRAVCAREKMRRKFCSERTNYSDSACALCLMPYALCHAKKKKSRILKFQIRLKNPKLKKTGKILKFEVNKKKTGKKSGKPQRRCWQPQR